MLNCAYYVGILILIRVDRAERKVLRRRRALRQHVEERRLADVRHADDADAQIGADAADQRLALRLLDLLGRHNAGSWVFSVLWFYIEWMERRKERVSIVV